MIDRVAAWRDEAIEFSKAEFEVHNIDVVVKITEPSKAVVAPDLGGRLEFGVSRRNVWLIIEIKPTLGDDYPTVLRKMKSPLPRHFRDSHLRSYLLIGNFRSDAITEEQLREIFDRSGISIVFLREVLAHLPDHPDGDVVDIRPSDEV